MTLHDAFHHPDEPPISNRMLAEFLLLFERAIMTKMQDLQSAVAAEDAVIGSAVTLINGIAQRIIDAGTDGDALAALTTDIQNQAATLAAAVAANTPAATAPSPSPAPAPSPAPDGGDDSTTSGAGTGDNP